MSGREWKPGDVAVATVRGVPSVRVIRIDYPTTPEWMTVGHGHPEGKVWHSAADLTDVRPLVVIDPEDREQVERLDAAIERVVSNYAAGRCGGVDALQAALREFANPTPPKPEEPRGLGAVVEDAEGERWVRVNRRTGTQEWRCCDFNGEFRNYDAIAAVRVLSEGIQ